METARAGTTVFRRRRALGRPLILLGDRSGQSGRARLRVTIKGRVHHVDQLRQATHLRAHQTSVQRSFVIVPIAVNPREHALSLMDRVDKRSEAETVCQLRCDVISA
jgi:hypothetical protein